MRDFILAFSAIGGVAAMVAGPLLAALFAGLSLWGRDAERAAIVSVASIALGVAAVGVGLGLALAWAGWQALRGAADRHVGGRRWGLWLALFVGVLWMGQGAVGRADAAVLMPVLQVTAGALPALLFLSIAVAAAGQGREQVARRPVLGSLAWGGLGGTSLALAVELILVIGAVALVVAALQVVDPALVERLLAAAQEMRAAGRPLDLAGLRDVVSSPLFAIALLGLLGVVAPLVEESLKGLAVPLVVAAGGRPGRLAGFLFGVAAGAGFAILEGILNGAMALNMTEAWAGLMLLRGAAAAMHCLASGLAGLGWQMILVERRWLAGGVLGLLALSLHGAWNLGVGIIGLVSVQTAGAGGAPTVVQIGVIGALALFMGCLWLAVVAGLALIPRRLARSEQLNPRIPTPE
jgi:RsiW-degrading membrane proteinase PrsW (M82 family)